MRSNQGLTLLELLASTVILGVLITVVLSPLAQLFQNTASSGQTLRVTTQAQEITEYIRGQWQTYPPAPDASGVDHRLIDSRNRYDRTCFTLPAIRNMSGTLSVRALDRNGSETGTLAWSACPNPLTAPTSFTLAPMKRITVALSAPDGSLSRLTLDIPRP